MKKHDVTACTYSIPFGRNLLLRKAAQYAVGDIDCGFSSSTFERFPIRIFF